MLANQSKALERLHNIAVRKQATFELSVKVARGRNEVILTDKTGENLPITLWGRNAAHFIEQVDQAGHKYSNLPIAVALERIAEPFIGSWK